MPPARLLPLEGLRVIDLTTVVFGSYTTQLLGDFGAEVVKVEPPGGDMTRDVGPARNPGMSSLFLGCNRNKKSIQLDLKRAPARDALWRLTEGADLFVHNVRPQKIASLGFDPDSVMGRKPDIVYGSLHGYLEEGPYGGRPAYDDVIQGEAGLAGTFLERDGVPTLIPTIVADKSAALLAATGLMGAMVQRLRTGKGVYIEVAMFEGLAGYTLIEHLSGATFSPPEGAPGYSRVLTKERRPFATADGHICVLAYTDRQWRSFWELAGAPERAAEPRFATMRARSANIGELYTLAAAELAKRPSAEWLALLREADIPAGPINRLSDLMSDPQLKATGFFRTCDHPSEGELMVPDTGIRLDRKPLPVREHAPRLGEHGRALLSEAGFDEAEIGRILEA